TLYRLAILDIGLNNVFSLAIFTGAAVLAYYAQRKELLLIFVTRYFLD
ncbi:unnamed protein product, partial [Adineta steineri]